LWAVLSKATGARASACLRGVIAVLTGRADYHSCIKQRSSGTVISILTMLALTLGLET